ncbi:MBL fold metallo-hydrolase [Alicyclobacillus fastidiosus]|uniref:MBL fold metallo-hydrolase n=1 Tax=Alicyclobacillus fastidiosus TaxID=392011 RepID=UPI0023EA4387|nr:MBL fold metallo-hydrolase [Alicyclobacillus fastidiosus]GMA66035.1 Zn-dependent hydrolase [Alicyclobacillus fastidiosus]
MQKLTKLSERILYLPPYQETDRPILGAVVGSERTLLIDAGNSSNHARQFREELLAIGVKGDWLALTHHHWDHVFGIKEVGLPTISHSMTKQKITEMQNLSWTDSALERRLHEKTVTAFALKAILMEFGNERNIELSLPHLTFETKLTLDLGGISCVIEHVGGDHADDSIILYIPEEKVLFLGDCLYAYISPGPWSYTIEKSLQLVEHLRQFDAEFVFLSHHDAPLNRDEFHYELSLLQKVAMLTKQCDGDEKLISQQLSTHFNRELTEDELETISFFMNGLQMEELN